MKGNIKMKKILSIVLALTMLCAMLIPMTISASAASANTLIKSYADAKDGDKLIDLLFGQKSGAYQPHMFGNGEASAHDDACYNTANPHVDVTKDGSTFTMVNDDLDAEGDQCGNLQYGGKINGLKAGKDANGNTYKYTYAFQAKFQAEDSANKHSGFYFCLNSAVETYTDALGRTITNIPGRDDGHTGAYGWWGHPLKSDGKTEMRYHVILRDGSTIKNLTSSLTEDFKNAVKAGIEDWYDIVIEIDGYKMNISFNGTWLGWWDFTDVATTVNGDSTDLAFVARLFNEDMTLGVRNVSIYKGIGIEIPKTGDANTAVFFAIIAVVALGGTVVASKKKSFN
jgi:LPXTG-motif cell wall-anchored protein